MVTARMPLERRRRSLTAAMRHFKKFDGVGKIFVDTIFVIFRRTNVFFERLSEATQSTSKLKEKNASMRPFSLQALQLKGHTR